MNRERVGVIGAGVAGLTAAHVLQRRYDVVLFEAESRLGGHAHTHDVPAGSGGTVAVDTGFLVHNRRTYPNLLRLFDELGVETRESEMSMSVRCLGCGLEYAGGKRLAGLVPHAGQLRRGRYLRMLTEVGRFHRNARRLLDSGSDTDSGVKGGSGAEGGDELTLGGFLAAGGYSRYFTDHFILPVIASVWSAGERVSLRYPARYLFTFLHNHGMLAVTGSPRWHTVVGGSRTYVERAAKNLTGLRVGVPVRAVSRHPDRVEIRDDADQRHVVDRVVIAAHADQALAMLADPTPDERRVLGAFTYSRNETWLHQDGSLLPTAPNARASWNYLKTACHEQGDSVAVTYDVNRLMRLGEPLPHLVTLNATDRVDPSTVVAKMVYEHPVYTPESVAAQRLLGALNTGTTAFAGAYHGWGFHEDGCAAGVRAARAFGVGW
jgi:predicted NAD/FAD-binding protein